MCFRLSPRTRRAIALATKLARPRARRRLRLSLRSEGSSAIRRICRESARAALRRLRVCDRRGAVLAGARGACAGSDPRLWGMPRRSLSGRDGRSAHRGTGGDGHCPSRGGVRSFVVDAVGEGEVALSEREPDFD